MLWILILTYLALLKGAKIYISPNKGCATSCTGSSRQPYDNIWSAMSQGISTDPTDEFILLYFQNEEHFLFLKEYNSNQTLRYSLPSSI